MSTPLDAVKRLMNHAIDRVQKVGVLTDADIQGANTVAGLRAMSEDTTEKARYSYRERFGEYHVWDGRERVIAICDREDDAIDITDALNDMYQREQQGDRGMNHYGTSREWMRRDNRRRDAIVRWTTRK